MSPFDRVKQLSETKKRGSSLPQLDAEFALSELAYIWADQNKPEDKLSVPVHVFAEYVLIRIVTALEVFTRAWTAALIDAGMPFAENAAKLDAARVKIDFALSQAIQGKRVSVGQIIGHEVATNSFAAIVHVLSTLIGHDLLDLMGADRHGNQIIADKVRMKADLVRAFELRHIVVHEMPTKNVVSAEEIDALLNAACLFVAAADVVLEIKLHGKYPPMTQTEMNLEAAQELASAEGQLTAFIKSAGLAESARFQKVKDAFEHFAEAHARWASHLDEPGWVGSGASMEYSLGKKILVEKFLDQLKQGSPFDENEGIDPTPSNQTKKTG